MIKVFLIFILLLSSIACSMSPKRNPNTIKDQLSCPISITNAQKNLESNGFIIIPPIRPTEIITDYKFSEKASKRFLFGSKSRDYYRRIIVEAQGPSSIVFNFDYKITVYSHPTENKEPLTIYEKGDPLALSDEDLKEMRNDVCKITEEKKRGMEIDSGMMKKCDEGDAPACIYLFNTLETDRPQEAIEFLKKACSKKKSAECSKL